MNITDLARKLPVEQLEQYLYSPIWQAAKERGLTWNEAVIDVVSVQFAYAALPMHASTLLRTMLIKFGAAPVGEEQLRDVIQQHTMLSGAEYRIGLQQLLQAGIIIAVRKVWGELLYFMPTECFVVWQQTLFPCTIIALPDSIRMQMMAIGAIRPSNRPFSRQLLSALASLARLGDPITSKGVLNKKTIQKLEQAVELDEQYFQSFKLNWPQQDHYSIKAAFVLESARALGILQLGEKQLQWNEARLTVWLSQDEETREKHLLEWVLQLLLPGAGAGAHCAATIRSLSPGQWHSASELDKWLSDHISSGLSVQSWYMLFHSLGWLERAELIDDGCSTELIRWKPSNTAAWNELVIQPNGEIIVSAGSSFALRWELELIAECANTLEEEVAVYRLTATSIAEAVQNGRTKTTIIAFLKEASGCAELPPTIESMIEEWTRSVCRSGFIEAVLLHFDDKEIADHVRGHPSIAPLLQESIGANYFIVDKSQVTELRRMLQKAGYPPRKGVLTATTMETPVVNYPFLFISDGIEQEVEQNHCLLPAIPFVHEHFPLQHFELPELQKSIATIQLLPELERVPVMWMKQLRKYHYSTRKELMEQALQWEVAVQLKMNRDVHSFLPERMEQRGGEWAVIGRIREDEERQSIRLTPDMWEEMMLLLPEETNPS